MKTRIEKSLTDFIESELEIKMGPNSIEADLLDVGIDSIALMRLIVFVEEEYSIQVSEDFMINSSFNSLASLISYVASNLE